ncbi:hypothetical protein BDFB_014858 [Asbolus verrucosus]|uniref:Uncharacterized protein n=1 Tax=Asbolus verrucosus TaxID=1661398 RepID=A0A482VPR1_ASBVE|nr:hypothetical protein BDFB_014858 [Asbolus verrucosus]
MERIILVNCAVLCVALLLIGVVLSVPHYDNQISVRNEGNDDKKLSHLWFGPRLGRKKRNLNGDDPSYRDAEIAGLMDVLQDCSIIAPNGNIAHFFGM